MELKEPDQELSKIKRIFDKIFSIVCLILKNLQMKKFLFILFVAVIFGLLSRGSLATENRGIKDNAVVAYNVIWPNFVLRNFTEVDLLSKLEAVEVEYTSRAELAESILNVYPVAMWAGSDKKQGKEVIEAFELFKNA